MVTSNQTITAVASPTGYLASAPASVTYAPTGTPANPVFSLSGGTYSGAQTLTITESTPGAAIYYTVDGPVPSTASAVYTQPLSVPASETVQAIAVAASGFASGVVSATLRHSHHRLQPGLCACRWADAVQRHHRPGRLPATVDRRR